MDFIESLIAADQSLFLSLTSQGNPSLDALFQTVTQPWISYLILLALLVHAFLRMSFQQAIRFAVILIAAIALADLASVHLLKNLVMRLRPCHAMADQFVLAATSCGGQYGFVSSHAATLFAAWGVMQASKASKNWLLALGLWALVVSYSRIYLGLHYPADILGGMLLGLVIAKGLHRWRGVPTFTTT
ncbi:MAG: phosphatase PAP2 family protein [Schleiferiaceae bacterium]|nr:phosphatase PAP2 family protein [Schleiferiaceae bacterium]